MHVGRTIDGMLGIAFPFFNLWCLTWALSERIRTEAGADRMLRFGRTFRVWWLVCGALLVVGFSSDIFLGRIRPDEVAQFWVVETGTGLPTEVHIPRHEASLKWTSLHRPPL